MKLLGMQSLSCFFHSYSTNCSKEKKNWISHLIRNKQLLRENNLKMGQICDKHLLLVSYSPCNETQRENRGQHGKGLCAGPGCTMPLHISLIHFLSRSLTNYGNNSQSEETSSHLQTLLWLNSPKVSPGERLWGSPLCQFSSIHFLPLALHW